mmetsp:Transcript_24641/g.29640  ORF Transcript_24641/g.29640 Transcript_24641/m.29640 type:complete len:191 (-) Transcript_24641:395-967(-)
MTKVRHHIPVEEPAEVEKAFEQMREEGGLKVDNHLETNWTALKGLNMDDIAANVQIALAREKDQKDVKRRILAEDVAWEVEHILQKVYTQDSEKADVILSVRVVLMSDGSKLGRPIGMGKTMLTLDFCLYARESGKWAMAKQICCSEDGGFLGKEIPNAARKMALAVAAKIQQEISDYRVICTKPEVHQS